MFSVSQVEKALRSMYHYGIEGSNYDEADVERMLNAINFPALAQAVQHDAVTVDSFAIESDIPGMFRYHGRELFGQRAALLYIDKPTSDKSAQFPDKSGLLLHLDIDGAILDADRAVPKNPVLIILNRLCAPFLCRISMGYAHELWMLEHGQLLVTGRVSVSFQSPFLGSLDVIYREQWRHPWENGVSVPLATLTQNLREMCESVKRGEYPLYEL